MGDDNILDLSETLREKLRRLKESNFFWAGGVGLILAAYAFITSAPKFSIALLIAGWLFTIIAIHELKFFERKSKSAQVAIQTLVSLVLAIVLAVLWLKLSPSPPLPLSAKCSVSADHSPCRIDCVVSNPNGVAVRDGTVGFQGFFPFSTQMAAAPEQRIRLRKAETLPLPDAGGNTHKEIRAFTVEIPILAPKTDIPFVLWTASEDNQKACRQVIKIQDQRREIMNDFYGVMVRTGVVRDSDLPDAGGVLSAQAVGSSLFIPGEVASEAGHSPVEFLTDGQKRMLASYTEIRDRYKPKFPLVFQNRGECDAPVWTAEQTNGEPFYFWNTPPDSTVIAKGKWQMSNGQVQVLPFPPKEYLCSPPKK
jgi:hypothetical protein